MAGTALDDHSGLVQAPEIMANDRVGDQPPR